MPAPKHDKLMRDALLMELHREDDIGGIPTKRLRRVASALIFKALDGDVAAIKEINDRVDGKVAQTSILEGGDKPIETVALTPMEAARRFAFAVEKAARLTKKDD